VATRGHQNVAWPTWPSLAPCNWWQRALRINEITSSPCSQQPWHGPKPNRSRRYAPVRDPSGPKRPSIPVQIVGSGVIAIARGLGAETATDVAAALARSGIQAFELTLNEPEDEALRAIEAVASRHAPSDFLVGAGTVLTVEAAAKAVDAGAAFLVMPHVDVDILQWAAERGIPSFPGAATPTEVLTAWRAGAAAIKVFPASSLGPLFIRELRGPFPHIPLVATGGVTGDNAAGYVAAGAVAIGVGSWLIGDARPARIAERAATLLAVIRQEGARRDASVTDRSKGRDHG
jgi:2-dehydro-3-deoxyphosphogluconate aldolase/(4S)-4-hydroxy-2-oxoglutarate aldolase